MANSGFDRLNPHLGRIPILVVEIVGTFYAMEELGEGVGLVALPAKWVSCSCWVFLALFLVFSWIFSRFLLSFLLKILTI